MSNGRIVGRSFRPVLGAGQRLAVKGWYAQREHSTFIAPDRAEIYLIDTIYMWHASREIKENGEPAIQVFLRSFSRDRVWRRDTRHVCWHKNAVRAGSTQWEEVPGCSGNKLLIYYLPTIGTISEKKRMVSTLYLVFALPPQAGKPRFTRWRTPQKTGLPGRKTGWLGPISW